MADVAEQTAKKNNQKYLSELGFDFNSVRKIPTGDHREVKVPGHCGFFIKDKAGLEHIMVVAIDQLPPAIATRLGIDTNTDPEAVKAFKANLIKNQGAYKPVKRLKPAAVTIKKKRANKAVKKSKKK